MGLFSVIGRLFDRDFRAIAVLGLVFAGGCGFSPVYGTLGSSDGSNYVQTELAATRIAIIEDREGQILHNLLLDRFHPNGRNPNGQHGLRVELIVDSVDLGTQIDATTTRSRLTVHASAVLSAYGKSEQFRASAVASFSTSESDYASLIAEQDAIERSLVVIADDLRLQIATFFEKQRRLNG